MTTTTRKRYTALDLRTREATAWPEGPLPKLEPKEAMSAAKRLYRFAMKRPFKGKVVLTSGNRYTWTRHGELRVNPDKGWRELVHDLSHLTHRRLHPKEGPHGWHHSRIEAAMVAKVVESGWLEGKLRRPEKPKPALADVRHARTLQSIKAWESKLKRATNALKKLRARRKYYERKAAA